MLSVDFKLGKHLFNNQVGELILTYFSIYIYHANYAGTFAKRYHVMLNLFQHLLPWGVRCCYPYVLHQTLNEIQGDTGLAKASMHIIHFGWYVK
jgi:hypothetical protein